MQKITPFLWYDNQAEEAANFYASVFKNVKITEVRRYPPNHPNGMADKVLTVSFNIEGQDFVGLNGGPYYKTTPGISFFVNCETQAEVDELWDKLGDGGSLMQCGWITDKFGITWQIVPSVLGKLLNDPDPVKAGRVMQAMMPMTKLDIAKLEAAYKG